MAKSFLGIDISKLHFDIALLINGKMKTKKFTNNLKGYEELSEWLAKKETGELHACMEATGSYGESLALYLYDRRFIISVINPAQIKGFALGKLARTKTDKADAQLIACFCQAMNPAVWKPAPASVRQLQALVNRLESLKKMQQQEENRFKVASETVQSSLKKVMDFLMQEIHQIKENIQQHLDEVPELKKKKALLLSIPSIGEATAAQILAFIGEAKQFQNVRQYVAYIGLNPKHCQSGSSIHKKTRLSKAGNTSLRKAFYMPALTAKRYNPCIKAFCKRLEKAGKPKMVIIGAAMNANLG